ncbi:MAG: phage major capsid protein [Actinobacteria bacterium]|nr:phage major capsid protein [Actinomycetota bacterium]
MSIDVTSGNSTVLASQIANLIVGPLQERSSFLAAGPRVIDTNQPLRIPRVASGSNTAFVAEGAEITEDNNWAFDEITLLPSTLKSFKTLVKLSNELIRTAAVAIDSVLQQQLVMDIAIALDKAFFDGAGTSNTVKGIFQQSGIATGVLDTTDVDSLWAAYTTAKNNFVDPTHWVMTPAVYQAFRTIKVGEDDARYVFDPSNAVAAGQPTMLGLPVILSSHIPVASTKARVALVDFNHVVVARDLATEVKVLTERYAEFDTTAIRLVSRWDVGLTQAKAVTLLTEA